MSLEQDKVMSALDIFVKSQETIDEAKKKSSDESGNRAKYLRLSQDGTMTVRILPLAPVIGADGNPILPMERKGYEYPIKELVLKIKDTAKDAKGKEKIVYVNVCNAKFAFPKLEADLIDVYVRRACEIYEDDSALCKKLKESSFNGGLKWDSKRCMYVFDIEKRNEGMQILQISYSQYKELEDRKLKLWTKLSKNGAKTPCPISSIANAYPLEITRKTEKKKTEYSYNIDTVAQEDVLTKEELTALLEAPRLPEVLYRYSRYHLGATIAFLTQFDEAMGINVMSDSSIQDCIDQIKMLLPADDQSNFTLGGDSNTGGSASAEGVDIDSLWATFDRLEEEGLDDRTEEGQELRASIKEYIEDNGMDIRLGRGKTNLDLLKEIEDVLLESDGGAADEEEERAPAPARKSAPARRPAPEPEPEEEPEDDEEEPEDDAPAAEPTPSRRGRNEDTAEPAARPERRGARPSRRR